MSKIDLNIAHCSLFIDNPGMRLTFLLASLLLLIACTAAPAPPQPATLPPPTHLWIGVSEEAGGLIELLETHYAPEGVVLHFVSGNEAALYDDLATGELDLIFIHHVPSQNSYWLNPVALSGVQVVVHPDNPLDNLSRQALRSLFSGDVTSWGDVGGGTGEVQLHVREKGSGARTIFRERVLREQRVGITAVVAPNPTALTAAVAADPQAIGYLISSQPPANLKPLAIDGISATSASLTDQSYPLMTPLYVLLDGQPFGPTRELIGWLQSPDGQGLVANFFTPLPEPASN